jgi:AraC family transcriptional regulator
MGGKSMNHQIIEKDRFQVVGIKRTFSLVNGENHTGIAKMWEEVHQNGTVKLLSSLNNGSLKGLIGVCTAHSDDQSGQTIDYWIAAEYNGEVPNGLLALEIPASKWGIFEVRGSMPEAIQKAWEQIFSEWLPSQHYKLAGTPQLEVYPDDDPTSPDFYSEIWVRLQ